MFEALLTALGLIGLFVGMDLAFGGFLAHWLGFSEEDSKWNADCENPVDKVVVATSAFGARRDESEGFVELNGARWNARASDDTQGFDQGDRARVERVDGLTLIVKSIEG